MTRHKIIVRTKGGPGSGHHGHSGLPGVHGGSRPGKGGSSATKAPATNVKREQARERLLKLESDDYQKRSARGNAPRSGIPDVIQVYRVQENRNDMRSPLSDKLMGVTAEFKNTSEKESMTSIRQLVAGRVGNAAISSVTAYQTGDYHDDWVTAELVVDLDKAI